MVRVVLCVLLGAVVCCQVAGSRGTLGWLAKRLGLNHDPELGVRDTTCCQFLPDWRSAVSLNCTCNQRRYRTKVGFIHDHGSVAPNSFGMFLMFLLMMNVSSSHCGYMEQSGMYVCICICRYNN